MPVEDKPAEDEVPDVPVEDEVHAEPAVPVHSCGGRVASGSTWGPGEMRAQLEAALVQCRLPDQIECRLPEVKHNLV